MVLGIPVHHPILPGSFEYPPTAPKRSRAVQNLKNIEKSIKTRILIRKTYFLVVLGSPAHHPTLLDSFRCPLTAPKCTRAAENSKNQLKFEF
jgi:hypothetical protein